MNEFNKIPDRLMAIIEEFQSSEPSEKMDLLLYYASLLPPLPDWILENKKIVQPIPECMTPVFIHGEKQNGKMVYFFDVPIESPTTRGFVAILWEGLQNLSPEQILSTPGNFYLEMGLEKILTLQRLNGISAILGYMKRFALAATSSE